MRTRNGLGSRWNGVVVCMLGMALLLTACASPEPGRATEAAPRPSADTPKTLRLAFREEPPSIHGGAAGTPEREVGELLNAGLTYFGPSGELLPKLAVKVPTVADGDWIVAPDGAMELTWKLKPGLKWHDGTAFTAEDLAFSIRVFKDPAWPGVIPSAVGLIGEAAATDPQTLMVRYPRTANTAPIAGATELPPLPRHLLEEQYRQAGAAAVANSAVLSLEWIGMGPYRMTNRVLGSQIDAVAFDDYVFGRPKIASLTVKWTQDANALLARLLSGDVDMVPNNMEATQGAILRQEWESAGRGTVTAVPTRLRQIQLQYRDPSAAWAGDVRVRQAMLQLLDRQALVDTVVAGLSTVGHAALLPSDPAYAQLQRRGLPTYALDRAQAERLLSAAGWTRGSDGIRHNAAGAIFRFNPANVGESDQDETLVLVDGLRQGGIASEPDVIPETAADQNERRARAHGVARPAVSDGTYWDRFLTAQASGEQNRWRGANTGGYSNPAFDRLVEQWRGTLDQPTLDERTAELHKLLLDELVALPLYYQVEIFAYRKGLQGPGTFSPRGRNATIDIHTWTIE